MCVARARCALLWRFVLNSYHGIFYLFVVLYFLLLIIFRSIIEWSCCVYTVGSCDSSTVRAGLVRVCGGVVFLFTQALLPYYMAGLVCVFVCVVHVLSRQGWFLDDDSALMILLLVPCFCCYHTLCTPFMHAALLLYKYAY